MVQKPSDTKGFWQSVTRHASSVTEISGDLRVTGSVTLSDSEVPDPLRDAYISIAESIRALWKSIPTASGGRKQGPRFIGVTLCADESEYGLTDSGQPADKRFTCKTCFGFAPTVWTDAPDKTPTRDEQEDVWAAFAAKQSPRTTAGARRDHLRAIGYLKGRD